MSAKFPNTKPDGLEKPEPPGPPPPKQLYAHSPAAGGMAQPTIDYSPGPVEWEPEPPGSPPATYNDLVARPIIIGADTAYWRKATECAEGALKDLTQSAKAKIAELEAECDTMRKVAEITEGALVASNETVRRLREENQRLVSESRRNVLRVQEVENENARLRREKTEAMAEAGKADNESVLMREQRDAARQELAATNRLLEVNADLIKRLRSVVEVAVNESAYAAVSSVVEFLEDAGADEACEETRLLFSKWRTKAAEKWEFIAASNWTLTEEPAKAEDFLERTDDATETEAAERIDEQIREANERWAERNS